jgi:hypothetical protein
MVEESKTMRKLHEIQVAIHEEMKGLAPEERVKKINQTAREFAKKHNLKLEFINKH